MSAELQTKTKAELQLERKFERLKVDLRNEVILAESAGCLATLKKLESGIEDKDTVEKFYGELVRFTKYVSNKHNFALTK